MKSGQRRTSFHNSCKVYLKMNLAHWHCYFSLIPAKWLKYAVSYLDCVCVPCNPRMVLNRMQFPVWFEITPHAHLSKWRWRHAQSSDVRLGESYIPAIQILLNHCTSQTEQKQWTDDSFRASWCWHRTRALLFHLCHAALLCSPQWRGHSLHFISLFSISIFKMHSPIHFLFARNSQTLVFLNIHTKKYFIGWLQRKQSGHRSFSVLLSICHTRQQSQFIILGKKYKGQEIIRYPDAQGGLGVYKYTTEKSEE